MLSVAAGSRGTAAGHSAPISSSRVTGTVPVQDEEGEQRPAEPARQPSLHARAADLQPDLAPQLDRDRALILLRLGQFAESALVTIVNPLADLARAEL